MRFVSYEWINFGIFVGLTFLLGAVILGLSSLLGPRRPRPEKLDPYECGVPLLASARERFSVHFYLVAIMFMLFDIETVFLVPWAVVFKSMGSAAFLSMAAFIVILGFGLWYLIRRGVLDLD